MVVSGDLASMIEGVLESWPRLEACVWGHIVWKGRSAGRNTIAIDGSAVVKVKVAIVSKPWRLDLYPSWHQWHDD